MKLWSIYRTDESPTNYYVVWSPTREAAIRAAHIEFFGIVLSYKLLSARLGTAQ